MRAKSGKIHLQRRRKVLKSAKGFRGGRHRLYRTAKSAVMKAGTHAFASRKQHKRHMRSLWITRINAASRVQGLSYSVFMDNLNKAGVNLDRRMLADIAMHDPEAFVTIVSATKR